MKKTPAARITVNTEASFGLSTIGANTIGNVTIEKVNDITLASIPGSAFGTVTLAENGEIKGNIEVAGTFNTALNLTTTGGNITIGETEFKGTENVLASEAETSVATVKGAVTYGKLDITAGTININANMTTTTNRLYTTGNTTVDKEAKVTGNWTHYSGVLTVNGKQDSNTLTVVSGKVDVAKGASVNRLLLKETSGPADIKGTVVKTLTTEGTRVNITGNDEDEKDGKVGELIVKAAVSAPAGEGGITLTDGIIEKISADYTEGDPTVVYSFGRSEILGHGAVASDEHKGNIAKLLFHSLWDGESYAEPAAPYDNTGVRAIYTAAQLAGLQKINGGLSNYVFKYYAYNISLGNNVWTGATLNGVKAFQGNGGRISDFSLPNTADASNIGFFTTLKPAAADATTGVGVTISDINFMNVSFVATSVKVENVGVVAGTIAANSTAKAVLENVTVNIAGNTYGSTGNKASTCIGGLVGTTKAETTFTNVKVVKSSGVTGDIAIAGYHSLGGIVGSAEASVTVNGMNTAVDLKAINVAYKTTNDYDVNVGKYGVYVGTMKSDTNIALTIGGSSADLKIATLPAISTDLTERFKQNFVVNSNNNAYRYDNAKQSVLGYSGHQLQTGNNAPIASENPKVYHNSGTALSAANVATWKPRGVNGEQQ